MNPRSAEEVIRRLKEAYATDDDAVLCIKINRDEGTLRTWRNRDHVPASVLEQAAAATDYAVEWLSGSLDAQKMRGAPRTPETDRSRTLLTTRELALVEIYRKLPEMLRRQVENVALLAHMAYQDRKNYHAREADFATPA